MLRITCDVGSLISGLDDLGRRQVPFAMAQALTQTARDIKAAEINEMQRVFDRPTNYTLNSLYVRPATKQRLEAIVWLKDDAFKGTPASKYLLPQIEGGRRRFKRFESALQRIGVLPSGWFAVPGQAAQMDAFGNMSRGQIVKILAYFQAFGEQGYRANTTHLGRERMRKGNAKKGIRGFEYVCLRERDGKLPPGIYLRLADDGSGRGAHLSHGGMKPVLVFVRSVSYRKAFRFFEVGAEVRDRVFMAHFHQALSRALQTARSA